MSTELPVSTKHLATSCSRMETTMTSVNSSLDTSFTFSLSGNPNNGLFLASFMVAPCVSITSTISLLAVSSVCRLVLRIHPLLHRERYCLHLFRPRYRCSRLFVLCRQHFASFLMVIRLLLRIVYFLETFLLSFFSVPYQRSGLVFHSLSNLELLLEVGSILPYRGPDFDGSDSTSLCQFLMILSGTAVLWYPLLWTSCHNTPGGWFHETRWAECSL